MRYWLYLGAKLAVALAFLYGLQVVVEHLFTVPPPPLERFGDQPIMFMHDLAFTFAIIAVWLLSTGLLYAVIWDHRRRCRTCFRRLIMPVSTGSWGHIFTFGRPATEWICPYGHGTLRIEELQITGKELPDWEAHDDNIWKELESYK
ncbi:MAG TPA: hypothetical protein VHZ07_20820 [Bryobacteraceae bacterium]|jgi:hypothetical protein|nr:hypothetical protein [Bryobacteraceae bacterium]